MVSPRQSNITRRSFITDVALAPVGASLIAGISPSTSQAAETKEGTDMSNGSNWFRDIYRQLHIDAHFGGFKDIYQNFDADKTARMFDEAGFQMVSYFAKCWAGYSYYPTTIGTVHPGIDRDFTGELTRALKKRGIKCIIYFMLGLERRYQKEHPDWIYNRDPKIVMPEKSAVGDSAIMCFRSPYVDTYGIPQMKEIIERYDVDGFFIDIVQHQFMEWNCYCKYCRESFDKEVGGDLPTENTDDKAFAYRRWQNRHMEAHMAKVQRELASVKPDIAIINNYTYMSRYPVTPPKFVKHVTWDTPVPTVGLFAWNFSFEARYLSTLPDVTWSCMNTRGNTWGEYSLREPEAFMSECATLLASGGLTYLSDIPYPHGNPDPAVMDVFGRVNKRTRDLEPYSKNCKPVKEVAVLHSADSIWSKEPILPTPTWTPGPAYHSVCGAHKAMVEGHVNIGILNSSVFADTLGNYRAAILPGQRILNERECAVIRRFVRDGGSLIVTGETGVRDTDNAVLEDFALADVLGVRYQGSSDTANCYLRMPAVDKRYGIPAMDVQIMGNYTRIATTTAQTLIDLVPPYEGIKNGTPPPAVDAEGPGVTVNTYGKGKAIYCAAHVFQAYYQADTPVLRQVALWLFDQVYPETSRLLTLENVPINVEVFYNQRGNERFIHLVNYSGDKRETGVPQTQSFSTVHGITVRLRLESKPDIVMLVPEDKNISFRYDKGWLIFETEPLNIHAVYRIQ